MPMEIGKSRDRQEVRGCLGLGEAGMEGDTRGVRGLLGVMNMSCTDCGNDCTTLRIY